MDKIELQYIEKINENTEILGHISNLETFEILHVTKSLQKALNIKEDEYKGKKCYEVMHDRMHLCSYCNNTKLKKGEFLKRYTYNAMLDAHLVARDTIIDNETFGTVRMTTYCDITEEVDQIKQLQTKASVDKAIIACAKTLLERNDLNKSIVEFLKTLSSYFSASSAYIFEKLEKNQYFEKSYEYVCDSCHSSAKVSQIPYKKMFSWLAGLQNDDVLYINSREDYIEQDSNPYQLLQEQNSFAIILVPLRRDGEIIGMMCVNNPTENLDDVNLTKTVSAFVANDLEKREMIKELENLSYIDKLSEVKNRNCYLNKIEQVNKTKPETLGIIFADINGLKKANDNLGHKYGDILIKWCAKFLERNIYSPVYRIGGDEFVVIADGITQEEFEKSVKNITETISQMPFTHMSIGCTFEKGDINIEKQIVNTDKIMYEDKQRYYKVQSYNTMNIDVECEKLKEQLLKLEADCQ